MATAARSLARDMFARCVILAGAIDMFTGKVNGNSAVLFNSPNGGKKESNRIKSST